MAPRLVIRILQCSRVPDEEAPLTMAPRFVIRILQFFQVQNPIRHFNYTNLVLASNIKILSMNPKRVKYRTIFRILTEFAEITLETIKVRKL